ncbi:unnamed protein product [Enterobius vermicularis]|uniref:Branched-chain-amino-acid aminotransferase n=1 Tax=Enterobius vermicularis TaxID=51028 RepID=A0A0N4V9G9_ENTVE|nr:unnamed protein product [Enterobius vermicularis]
MSVGRKLTSVLLKQSVNVQCQRWFSAAVRLDDDEVYKRSKTAKTFLYRDLQIIRAKPEQLQQKPKPSEPLKFGQIFSDYMAEVDWTASNGWSKPVICPIHDFKLHPAAKVLHYAVEAFEGMKAYRGVDGKVRLFRPDKNMERLKRSIARATLPTFSFTELLEIIKELVCLDKEWIPSGTGHALYIRPAVIGTDKQLGVSISHEAKLFVITGPTGPYFNSKVTLYADPSFARSNYGPSIMISTEAQTKGCQQVLWLYGPDELITEVGATNIFFMWKNNHGEDELVTPPLSEGLILPGVTRESILHLAREWKDDIKVTEKYVGMREFREAVKNKRVYEMFCSGTACVVTPVEKILYNNKQTGTIEELILPSNVKNSVMERLYKQITDIQHGKVDRPEWTQIVC